MNPVDSTAATGLSQLERLTNTFSAPSKTFADIKNGNRSWWLPLMVLALFGYMLLGTVVYKVGIQQTIQNQIQMSPKAQEQMAQATPEQREKAITFWTGFTEAIFIASPAFRILYAVAISAVLLGTINFGFGGRARYGDVFAVTYYAWLPQTIQVLMGIAVLWFQPPEQFNIKNFSPTNAAALFLDPTYSNKALYALASSVDLITIWTLVLLSVGLATVAGLKRSSAYIAVFGWWAIVVLFQVGWAAAFS